MAESKTIMHICPACGYSGSHKLILTQQQLRALSLLADGFHGKDIAGEMEIDLRTVKAHLGEAFLRLGLESTRGRLSYVRAAVWWNCELFQIGLRELGAI